MSRNGANYCNNINIRECAQCILSHLANFKVKTLWDGQRGKLKEKDKKRDELLEPTEINFCLFPVRSFFRLLCTDAQYMSTVKFNQQTLGSISAVNVYKLWHNV